MVRHAVNASVLSLSIEAPLKTDRALCLAATQR